MNKVEITWLDSDIPADGGPWYSHDELDKLRKGGNTYCYTCGYIYHETDETIEIVGSHHEGQVMHPLTIPKAAIVTRVELGPALTTGDFS